MLRTGIITIYLRMRYVVGRGFINSYLSGALTSSVPFPSALKTRKSKTVNGKPHTMATTPATTECHLMQPIAKSTTAQIEKKTSAVGRFIYTTLSSTPSNAEHRCREQGLSPPISECDEISDRSLMP